MDPSNPAVFWFFALGSAALGVLMVGVVAWFLVISRRQLSQGEERLAHRIDDLEMELAVLKDRVETVGRALEKPEAD